MDGGKTDNKGEVTPSGTTPVIVSGGDGKRRLRFLSMSELSKKYWYSAGAILGLVVIVLIVLHLTQAVAFTIDGKKYYKSTIAGMATYAKTQGRPTKDDQAKAIFDLYKTQVAAQKVGITPNAQELAAAQKTLTPEDSSRADKKYEQLVAYNVALNQAYTRYKEGGYEGYSFVFDFSEKIQPTPQDEQPVAGYHDQAQIAADNKYAKQQADTAYSAYTKDPQKVSDLTASIAKARRTGFNGQVFHFTAGKGELRSQVFFTDVYNYITSQNKPGVSKVMTGKVDSTFGANNNPQPGYYYFVAITAAGKLVNDPAKVVNSQITKLRTTYHGV